MEVKKIYYMDCDLHGRQYHDADEVWEKLKVGKILQLVRDKDNKYDHNAVAVVYNDEETKEEHCIGYIPKSENKDLAAFLEMGWADIFECRINQIRTEVHPDHQISMTIKIKKREK